MATKSISKDIVIKNKVLCRGLVKALESAQKKTGRDVVYSKKVREVSGEQLKNLFGDK